MDRDYISYKCPVCGYEMIMSFYSSGYGDWRSDVDLQAANADREANILNNLCPLCHKGKMTRKRWLINQEPIARNMSTDDYLSLLNEGAEAWNSWRRHELARSGPTPGVAPATLASRGCQVPNISLSFPVAPPTGGR